MTGIENLIGSDFDDNVEGNSDANAISGGHDVITDFDPLEDALELVDPYGNSSPKVTVGAAADGDVMLSFNGGTVELDGVQTRAGLRSRTCRMLGSISNTLWSTDRWSAYSKHALAGKPAGASWFCRTCYDWFLSPESPN